MVAVCCGTPPSLLASELPFVHYTTDGDSRRVPSAEISAVYQDRAGFMWFGAYSSGVVRYDGLDMDLYTTADGLRDVNIWDVMQDGNGRLWVGSNEGIVVSAKPLDDYAIGERVHFTERIGGTELVRTEVRANRIAVDGHGRVWVGTPGDGIIRYTFADTELVAVDTLGTDVAGDGSNDAVRSMVRRRDGTMWVAVRGGDVLVYGDADVPQEVITEADGAPRQSVNVMVETADGILYGGCRDGRVWQAVFGERGWTIQVVNNDLTATIRAFVPTKRHTVWVSSDGEGAIEMDATGTTARRVARRNGLLSGTVNDMLEDHEGNLWFAQSGGISKLRHNYRAFDNFTAQARGNEPANLPAPGVTVVVPRNDGELWLGTSGGGIVRVVDDVADRVVDVSSGLRDAWINGLAFDAAGRLWVGTPSGIECIAMGATASPPSPLSQPTGALGRRATVTRFRDTSIYACERFDIGTGDGGSAESLWFPGFHNLFCYTDGRWYIFRDTSGLPTTPFQGAAVDRSGHVWVGTRDAGLYRSTRPLDQTAIASLESEPILWQLDGKTWPADGRWGRFGAQVTEPVFESVWSARTGAPTDEVYKLLWVDDAMWVGTPKGLFVFDAEGTMRARLDPQSGLPNENVSSIAASSRSGALWVGTNLGLAEVVRGSREVVRIVNKEDGLVDNEVWYTGSVALDSEGAVYFGSARGITRYRPREDRANEVAPAVVIQRAAFSENNFGTNEIAIEYAGLSFSNERRVRYRTRLVGFDRDWSAPTADVKIRYTNLPAYFFPRTYRFEVQAANDDGVWTPLPIQHRFAVRPALWLRWWSVLVQVLALVALSWMAQRYRTRKLEQQKRELEETVRDRTAEIRAQAEILEFQNTELEEKNAEIVRTQKQLIVQEKLASLGALTAGIAHEIKNPLNFVNNFARLSVDLIEDLREDIGKGASALDEDTKEDIEDILTDLEQNVTKINEHGKRADGIVKGMLAHSEGQKGVAQSVDIRALLDEHVNLAYHGVRAGDQEFNLTIEREYASTLPEIEVIPQDLGRVFLNVVNNACYATRARARQGADGYIPTLSLKVSQDENMIVVRIRDNGTGIPPDVREKIFNPFFTTKPTGEGTGLGLSLSYDIVVQGHGGEIEVDSAEGQFTEFIIRLPVTTAKKATT